VLNVGPEKLILLLVLALIVLGPQRLPDAARSLGKLVAELRRMSGRLQEEMHGALGEHSEAFTEAVGTLREGFGGVLTPSAPYPSAPYPSAPYPYPYPSPAAGAFTTPPPAIPPVPERTVPSSHAAPPVTPDDPSLN
jgi:sec-independent protein translocase protein TatB